MQDLRFCVCLFLYFTTTVLGCRRKLFKGYNLGAFLAVRFVMMLLLYLNNKMFISQEYTEQGYVYHCLNCLITCNVMTIAASIKRTYSV